mgnify:CR=1 FL=1
MHLVTLKADLEKTAGEAINPCETQDLHDIVPRNRALLPRGFLMQRAKHSAVRVDGSVTARFGIAEHAAFLSRGNPHSLRVRVNGWLFPVHVRALWLLHCSNLPSTHPTIKAKRRAVEIGEDMLQLRFEQLRLVVHSGC